MNIAEFLLPGMIEENDQNINYEEENNESDAVDLKDKLKKIKEKLEQCQKEKQDYLTGWQRTQADFINYKRRQEEQTADLSKLLCAELIKDILPVIDALEPRVNADLGADKRGAEEIISGLQMVKEQLMKILSKHGLTEMKSIGEKFNHEMHEAIEQVEAEGEEGMVAEETQKGYLLNGKVIRVAKVKVTK